MGIFGKRNGSGNGHGLVERPSLIDRLTSGRVLLGSLVSAMVALFVAGWIALGKIEGIAAGKVAAHAAALSPKDAEQDRELSELRATMTLVRGTARETRDEMVKLRSDFYLFATGRQSQIKPPAGAGGTP